MLSFKKVPNRVNIAF